jgi:hypothetical protein
MPSNSKRQVDLIKAYNEVFNSEHGQIVLFDLMDRSYLLRPTHDEGNDIVHSHKNEGKRELMLEILTKVETNSLQLITYIRKQKQHKEQYSELN